MPTLEFEGRTLFYRDNGRDGGRDGGAAQGPALLLFHAFPLDSRMWQQQLDDLKGSHRVIALDSSGFGASSVPGDPASYSVDRWADEGRAILRSLGIERAVVGGCSMGGYVSLAFLRRHREAAAGLILVDTRADPDTPEVKVSRQEQQQEVLAQGTGELRERLFSRLLSEKNLRGGPIAAQVRSLLDQPAAGIVGALEAMQKRPDSTPSLLSIDIPTLVIVGEEDGLTPPAIAEGMARSIPGAGLVTLPRAGHLANLEEPEAFHRALQRFLDGVGG